MTVRRVYQCIVGSLMIASMCSITAATAAESGASNKKIKILAQDGAFTPSVIQSAAHGNAIVSIHAKDKDYPFVVPDVGVTMTIKKGSSVDIEIGSFGAGKHLFSCGSDCGGFIDLIVLRDEEG